MEKETFLLGVGTLTAKSIKKNIFLGNCTMNTAAAALSGLNLRGMNAYERVACYIL